MSDNVIELNIFTAAQYWEAQADMWHANYADAQKEIEKLREALKLIAETYNKPTTSKDGLAFIAAAALKETGD